MEVAFIDDGATVAQYSLTPRGKARPFAKGTLGWNLSVAGDGKRINLPMPDGGLASCAISLSVVAPASATSTTRALAEKQAQEKLAKRTQSDDEILALAAKIQARKNGPVTTHKPASK